MDFTIHIPNEQLDEVCHAMCGEFVENSTEMMQQCIINMMNKMVLANRNRDRANLNTDDITITVIPVILGRGIPLFGKVGDDISLRHIATKTFDFGFVQSTYKVKTKE